MDNPSETSPIIYRDAATFALNIGAENQELLNALSTAINNDDHGLALETSSSISFISRRL
ncbi:uncharacterized protein RCC_00334 [Ramularia collo-cygni]|uniref:Uncharacterized protein n=1 Tax=Ramularia collo-cygni TaxID=112498 RepID=A0A2D3US28_9PEZI|nr:uncharacterized protein RCC_00334 [Ramularia collo-cygni]CZT14357.1 uncharacterized protein RCC_00334 [Ramularia collo-cygni]